MESLLREASPAIEARLAALGSGGSGRPELQGRIQTMARIARTNSAIDAMSLGNALFHGFDSLEASIKLLLEHGLRPEDPHLGKCLDMLLSTDEDHPLYARGLSKAGRILEDAGHSGARSIKASLLAQAGFPEEGALRGRVAHSLATFEAASRFSCLEELALEKGGKWIFRKAVLFPEYYDLRILAFTESWKTRENLATVARAVDNLARLSPIPPIYIDYKGQLIAPGSYLMQGFGDTFAESSDDGKAEWLLRSEYCARLGILPRSSLGAGILRQLGEAEALAAAARTISKSYSFMKWGAYTGVSLEDDWKKPQRKLNDLAFRFELIRRLGGWLGAPS